MDNKPTKNIQHPSNSKDVKRVGNKMAGKPLIKDKMIRNTINKGK